MKGVATKRQLTPQRVRMKISRGKNGQKMKDPFYFQKFLNFCPHKPQIPGAAQECCVPKIGLPEHPRGEITRNSKERP